MSPFSLLRLFFAGTAIAFAASPSIAAPYKVDVYAASVGKPFPAEVSSVATLQRSTNFSQASFAYDGPLDFANNERQNSAASGDVTSLFFGANAANISDYKGVKVAVNAPYGSYATPGSFLASSGSINGYGYGSLYVFTYEGSTLGTNLTITHDDGVGVYVNDVLIPGTTTGPTSAITETISLPAGEGFQLVYGRENGSPSVLKVEVPEPLSAAVLGAGLLSLGLVRRWTTRAA